MVALSSASTRGAWLAGAWGNPEPYYRAARYVSTAFPFWNRSRGADHLWAVARDTATCATPWGSVIDELRHARLLSNWGGVTGLSGRVEERCFEPKQDLVVPGALTQAVVKRSPFWTQPEKLAAQV